MLVPHAVFVAILVQLLLVDHRFGLLMRARLLLLGLPLRPFLEDEFLLWNLHDDVVGNLEACQLVEELSDLGETLVMGHILRVVHRVDPVTVRRASGVELLPTALDEGTDIVKQCSAVIRAGYEELVEGLLGAGLLPPVLFVLHIEHRQSGFFQIGHALQVFRSLLSSALHHEELDSVHLRSVVLPLCDHRTVLKVPDNHSPIT